MAGLLVLVLVQGNHTIPVLAGPPFSQFVDPNPSPGNRFGEQVVVLSTGNVVITSPGDDLAATDAGAVYLFNGATGALISALRGSTATDEIGNGGITALKNGNYVISSPNWDGAAADVGAVTWGSGVTGVAGTVSASNSLVGSTAADYVGQSVTVLTNGNYVVPSPNWDGVAADVGAATWGNGATGVTGAVSASNSLVGSSGSDLVGLQISALTNGNYVVGSSRWGGTVGAVTWGSGTSGVVGVVSASNSLVGSVAGDYVGAFGHHASATAVRVLPNGNYLVGSPYWMGLAGALTWGNGTVGVVGVVGAANSLVGASPFDSVGNSVTVLPNGNYLAVSPAALGGAGAVTWGSGASGVAGAVTASNSLVGSKSDDGVGNGGVTVLSSGNYLVRSSSWDGAAEDVGAVTWGSGATGVIGPVGASNSLVGSSFNDCVGCSGTIALSNGNYVVSSPWWDGVGADVGAVTFGAGATGVVGAVSASNSLIGSTAGDAVGVSGVTGLTNGNYVVSSSAWGGNRGAITWANGTTGLTGTVTISNSLVGSTAGNYVGNGGVTLLTNGNFVVNSPNWDDTATDVGAVTWGSGTTGVVGTVSASNSLVGSSNGDSVGGNGAITALPNGNYVVDTPAWHLGAANVGAVTWGNGATGVVGIVSSSNSVVGSVNGDYVGNGGITVLSNGNYVIKSPSWGGAGSYFGAVTWGSGTSGVAGVVSASNSLIGSTLNDQVGNNGVEPLANGSYVVKSSTWNGGAGAVTWGDGTTGRVGAVSASNSLVGAAAAAGLSYEVPIDEVNGTYIASFVNEGGGKVRVGSQYDGLALTPILGPVSVSGISGTGAGLSGSVTGDNGNAVTARGFVYSGTSANAYPLIGGGGVTDVTQGTGIGAMSTAISGLAAGTRYSFRSYATNAVGTNYGPVAQFTTPTVPGAPTIVTATPGNALVLVAFSAPTSDGGAPITGYTATCGGQSASGGGSPITVTGLTNGVAVSCTVRAINVAGSGPASGASGSVIPATVPDAPTIGVAIGRDRYVSVTFTAPSSTGGLPITSYLATCGSQSATGSASPIVVTGLTNGVSVTCAVKAINGVGTGAASAASNSVTPQPDPSLSINHVSAAEGDSGTKTFTFTVTLSAASPVTVTVGWATQDGTASAGSDYTAASGTLTFAPGETSKTLGVSVLGDAVSESNEGFGVLLSSAVNATISRAIGQGTIVNDDASSAPSRPQPSWQEFFAVDTLETPYVGDFNGDRKVDIITFTRQNPNAIGDVYVSLSDGAKFGANTKWHDFFAISTDESVIIGDYNGDGKDDIATWLGKASRQVYVALSTGSGMLTESAWVNSIGTDATDLIFAGDANGDGKDDLIAFARKQGKVYVAISDGTKFATPAVWHGFFAVSTYERPRVADVNGDGKADIVTFATDSPTAFGDVYVATSDGTQFVGPTGAPNDSSKWHDFFAIRPTEEIRIGDLNGDGKDDFFTFLPPPFAQAYSVLSQGTSMADNALWAEAVAPLLGAGDNVYVGDVNGDGKADIIIFAQKEGKVFVSLAP